MVVDRSNNMRASQEGNISPRLEEIPVLIVGAGPTGLLGAVLLRKLGVNCFIIERHYERLTAPKAHAVGPRALEILRQAGVNVAELRKRGTKRLEGSFVSVVTSLAGEELRKFPYERTDVEVLDDTPEMLHNVPQPMTEQILTEQLGSTVEIRKGHSYVSCVNTATGVDTIVEDRKTGELYTIRSKHLLACDGARSQVRKSLDFEIVGESTTEMLMTIEISCDLRELVKDRRRILYNIFDPVAHGVLIAYDLAHKQVIIHNFDPKAQLFSSWNEATCRQLVETALGAKVPFTIDSFRPWELQSKIASNYRHGNCFLAGDAAHSFPPSAGIGLNTGFGDIHNLAPKIAAVHHNWAMEDILDSYTSERRPVAVTNSQQSVANGLKLHGLTRKLGLDKENPAEGRQRVRSLLCNQNKDDNDDSVSRQLDSLSSNFNNLELHLGYVYRQPGLSKTASNFEAKYVPGARLPHIWIRPLNDKVMGGIPPVNLDHIHELSVDEKTLRQYSTLDLCRLDHFTIIVNSSTTLHLDTTQGTEAQQARNTIPPVRVIHLDRDFELVFPRKDQSWLEHLFLGEGQRGGVVVRPDQHISRVWEELPSATEIEQDMLSGWGF